MSEQELEHKMKQILDDYAPILNVTPEAALLDQKPSQTKTVKKETKPKNIVANQTSKPPIKTVSQKSQDDLEPIEESKSENKNKAVESQSLIPGITDQDSTS